MSLLAFSSSPSSSFRPSLPPLVRWPLNFADGTRFSPRYAQQQDMYYYPAAGEAAMQFPYLQYQYAVQTYSPTSSSQDDMAPALYAVPMQMLPVGMMA